MRKIKLTRKRRKTNQIKVLDLVTLTVEFPEHKLWRRQLGTVVEIGEDDVFLINFRGDDGKTHIMLPLSTEQFIKS